MCSRSSRPGESAASEQHARLDGGVLGQRGALLPCTMKLGCRLLPGSQMESRIPRRSSSNLSAARACRHGRAQRAATNSPSGSLGRNEDPLGILNYRPRIRQPRSRMAARIVGTWSTNDGYIGSQPSCDFALALLTRNDVVSELMRGRPMIIPINHGGMFPTRRCSEAPVTASTRVRNVIG